MFKIARKVVGKITKFVVIAYITDLVRRKVYGEVKQVAKKAAKKAIKKAAKKIAGPKKSKK